MPRPSRIVAGGTVALAVSLAVALAVPAGMAYRSGGGYCGWQDGHRCEMHRVTHRDTPVPQWCAAVSPDAVAFGYPAGSTRYVTNPSMCGKASE